VESQASEVEIILYQKLIKIACALVQKGMAWKKAFMSFQNYQKILNLKFDIKLLLLNLPPSWLLLRLSENEILKLKMEHILSEKPPRK